MRLLVLGGTAWLGRCVADTAVARGDSVTCLARGESGDVPTGVTLVRADRDGPDAYADVMTQDWDVVVDVSRQPGQVRRAVEALEPRTERFVLVSSGNVYAGTSTPGEDETAELLPPLDGDVMESMESYGPAKVACEQHVVTAFGPDRSLVARVGLIGGPGDIFGRTGYWPLRLARPSRPDGAVLVPDVPGLPTQVIDVRDLAAWLLDASGRGVFGAVNVTGDIVPFGDHLAVAQDVAGHTGPLIRVDADWLAAHDVQPWMGPRSLPLWLPMPEYAGFSARSNAAARSAGLVTRPLAETLADTLAWELTEGADRPRKAGLTTDEERALLEEFSAPGSG